MNNDKIEKYLDHKINEGKKNILISTNNIKVEFDENAGKYFVEVYNTDFVDVWIFDKNKKKKVS